MLSLGFLYLDNAGGFNPNSSEANELRRLQRLAFNKEKTPESTTNEKFSPIPLGLQGNAEIKKGILVPESDIANRDPIGEKQGIKVLGSKTLKINGMCGYAEDHYAKW